MTIAIDEIACPQHKKGEYCVYLLHCSDGNLYCGSTSNLLNRLKMHNLGRAALWTKMRRPVQLVYFEKYPSLLLTRRRERQIKGWTVQKKLNLIQGIWGKI